MPTYEYRCKECGNDVEVVQSFADDALTTCDACGGPLRKVFGSVGIAFKGTGFYKNDSRGKSKTTTPAGTGDGGSSSTSTDSGSSSSTSEGGSTSSDTKKPEAKPAKKADSSSSKST